MNLGQKTLVIVFLTLVGLMAVLYATARVLILRSFLDLEQQETRTAVQRAENALNDDTSSLTATANDYAAWDRTYSFMGHYSNSYIQQEFANDTLQGLSLNFVLMMDPAGHVVFSKDMTFSQNTKSMLQKSAIRSLPIPGYGERRLLLLPSREFFSSPTARS